MALPGKRRREAREAREAGKGKVRRPRGPRGVPGPGLRAAESSAWPDGERSPGDRAGPAPPGRAPDVSSQRSGREVGVVTGVPRAAGGAESNPGLSPTARRGGNPAPGLFPLPGLGRSWDRQLLVGRRVSRFPSRRSAAARLLLPLPVSVGEGPRRRANLPARADGPAARAAGGGAGPRSGRRPGAGRAPPARERG